MTEEEREELNQFFSDNADVLEPLTVRLQSFIDASDFRRVSLMVAHIVKVAELVMNISRAVVEAEQTHGHA